MKKFRLLIISVVILVAALALGLIFWYINATSTPAGNSDKNISFEVKIGDSPQTIATNLKTAGLISDTNAFNIYIKLNPTLSEGIKSGTFLLKQTMTIKDIVASFQISPKANQVRVTIPEGLRYDEIVSIIDKAFDDQDGTKFNKDEMTAIIKSPDEVSFSSQVKSFLVKYKPENATLEGYLYPDTYFFEQTATAKDVVEKLVSTLNDKLTDDDMSKIQASSYSFYEIIEIASMMEREAFSSSEMPDIADVIYKRLEKGVNGVKLLQIDATLLYEAKDWKTNAFLLKKKDTPYNTYIHTGLPPTPISNPGIAAIRATLNPKSNAYYFYIHDNTGLIHFAKTLAEHEANIRKYL